MNQKGFAVIFVVLGIILVIGIAAGAYYFGKLGKVNSPQVQQNQFTNQNNNPTQPPSLPTNAKTTPAKPSNINKLTFIQNGDVTVLDLKTNQTKKITSYGYNTLPIISPDNLKVAYLSIPQVAVNSGKVSKGDGSFGPPYSYGEYQDVRNVWIINADGSNPIQVTVDPKKRASITWSADSSKIAFEEESGIAEYSLNNKTKTTLVPNGTNPVYSPTNSYMAYLTNNGKTIVLRLGSQEKRIDRSNRVSDFNWSQSEDKLFYTSLNQKDQKGTSSLGVKFSIWAYSLVNGTEKQITDEQMNISSPTVSPNGSYIVANQGSGYADAGNIDLSSVVVGLNNDLVITKQLKLTDFKGPDYFEKEKQYMFPTGNVVWVNDKEFLIMLSELLEPKPNPRGLYKLNVETLTAERLFELQY